MPMTFYKLEYTKASYFADFAVYLLAVVCASAFLLLFAPPSEQLAIAICITGGLIGWSLLEYLLHRFVLHGPQPFRAWHLEHHQRPRALIGTPTAISVGLILGLMFLPMLVLAGPWRASGFTLGVAIGYLTYAWTHHALHHWRTDGAWLKSCKRQHAVHHGSHKGCQYGVTTAFWDRVFFSDFASKRLTSDPVSSAVADISA
jgi:sterol desaturase/sphingolipid hydroxylase (fatty acid hydroxylase superfamily)